MNKIGIILPYYGKFPNYFDLWLASAGKNQDIDFILITDSKVPAYQFPENIKIVIMTISEIRDRVSKEVGFSVSLESPYKLCDYKPTYGAIFEDLLKEYTHWGYCDSDVIFGDLRKFLTDELLAEYDRIYDLGHMSIYKNNYENNRRWKVKDNLYTYTYKEVFRVKHCKMFDERGGMWDIWKQSGASEYIAREEIADIFVNPVEFTTWYSSDPQWYEYNNGSLVGHFTNLKTGEEKIKEFAYIHLQKRRMNNFSKSANLFFIVPNCFLDNLENSDVEVSENYIESSRSKNSMLKRIRGALSKDELVFHLRVAFRRCGYWIKGQGRGIRYQYF